MRLNTLEGTLTFVPLLGALTLAGACGDEHLATPDAGAMPDSGGETTPVPATTLMLDATGGKHAFASLRESKTVEVTAPDGSDAWDISLASYLLQTNSGPSGPGSGGAYGPVTDMPFDEIASAAVVPHSSAWRADRIASPFDGWYLYDKCPAGMHTLASRFHDYGIESGGRRWKLQIVTYYGLVMGAPQSARYAVRFAEVTSSGSAATQRIADLDASTAAFLDLASGAPVALTEADAASSPAWDIGFRRSDIFVNGGVAGPKGVRGVDLDAARVDVDADICAMSEASEQGRFDAVAASQLAAPTLAWRTSDIEGALKDAWYAYDPISHTISPGTGTWIVRGADGATFFKLAVVAIDGASMTDAGRLTVKLAPIAAGM
jgi:hypothetical protein